MRAIVDDPITHPSELVPIAPELDAIVMRALRKRKDARFGSAHEMAVALEKFAFSTPGFSPMQVASYTKSLFAAEYLQWRKTATAALDLEVEKPRDGGGPGMGGLNAEPQTAGPTMALRPGVSWSDGRSEARSAVGRSRSSQSQGNGQPRSQATNGRSAAVETPPPGTGSGVAVAAKRDRTWMYAVVGALLAILGGGAWMVTRQQEIPSVSAPTAATPAAARVPAAADSPSWNGVARPGKTKTTGARRHARVRAAATSTDDGDQKEKAAAPAVEPQKADPFAD
jgi:hypothetical protein